MHKFIIPLLVLLIVLILAALVIGWLVLKRPHWVFAKASRRTLKRHGLQKVTVPSPVGPQNVFVGGSGPLLVMVHGLGDQAGTWARVVPALVKRFTLILPDLAGHGESAPFTGPIEASTVLAGLEAVIATQAQGQPVILVGNSLGAWQAMVLAKRHPEWVERLVALDGGALRGYASKARFLPRTREEARETVSQVRAPGKMAPNFVLDDMVRRAARKDTPMARFLSAVATMDALGLDAEQLRSLDLPVHLLWGAHDQVMPLEYAKRLLPLLPNAKLTVLDQCGHLPQQEAPEKFLGALLAILPEPA